VPRGPILATLLAAAVVLLTAAAWLRGAEYDEQYTLFLTGGVARPIWPAHAFAAGDVRAMQAGHAGFGAIVRDLRASDVHPPLYFWAVGAWRRLVGDGLFAARLFSVLCGVGALGLVVVVARRVGASAVMALLLTLGCYGFVYINVVARGFALAQLLLLAGVAVLSAARRPGRVQGVAAGMLLGAATFTNYLAVFVALGALCWWCAWPRLRLPEERAFWRRGLAAVLGFAVWLPADAWFFLAQRGSRAGQFPPFELGPSLARLVRYFGANLFGGLPLYIGGGIASSAVSAILGVLLFGLIVLIVWRWRHGAEPARRALLALCAAAMPVGLLLLGLVFDNTPIELRYLAFATPFIGLLLATLPRSVCGVVLAIQAASIAGLIMRPETMQPARATAMAAAALVDDGVVLVPRGNDGVGIVGAFAIEAPQGLHMLVIGRDDSPAQIRTRVSQYQRVVLALLGQDADSRATLPAMHDAFVGPCWRAAGAVNGALAFARICGE
jgi:4-amino-4-deoxy-L-arabinose transferase-like glycosyltransferase